jgi:hypothetical protein
VVAHGGGCAMGGGSASGSRAHAAAPHVDLTSGGAWMGLAGLSMGLAGSIDRLAGFFFID